MTHKFWLRVKLSADDLAALQQSAPDCELRQLEDGDAESQWLSEVEGVFTEEPLPDSLVQQMPNLRWLHVTRGGVNAYLTPMVKARPIQVTGSKGIHGAVFSEFALACILALAKKLPQCMDAQKHKQWQRLQPFEIEGQTIGIVGLGVAGSELARKAKALGMRVIATKRSPNSISPITSTNWAGRNSCRGCFRSPTSWYCFSPPCPRRSTSSAKMNCA